MKRLIIPLAVLVFTVFASAQEPAFRLKDLDDNWKEYGDLKGSALTVIDFWATWCQPCVRSMPLLNEIAKEFEEQGVRFIGVSVDGSRNQAKIAPFVRSMGITYPILRDMDSELMQNLGVTAVPTLIIFDSSGDQVFYHEGYRPGDEQLIREHLSGQLGD